MSFSDYSTTPSANTSIAGKSIGEGATSPGNVNDVLRQFAADGKELADAVDAIVPGMPVAGGTFTGSISYTGRGAFRHNNDATLIDGRDYHLAEGSSLPGTPAEGMRVWFYAT